MAFNLSIEEFNALAQAALKDATCDFEKSKVADRLRTTLAGRIHTAPAASDSLELRRDLAACINRMYRNDDTNRVVIPRAVAEALKVDCLASGFTRQADGSIVATNHPLTDRRLVAIMTAINLNGQDRLGAACESLDRDVAAAFANEDHSVGYNLFMVSAKHALSCLTGTIRAAGEQKVKPATLKRFLPALKNELVQIRESFLGMQAQFSDAERTRLQDLVTRALDIGRSFGGQVDRLPALPPIAPILVVAPDDLHGRDVLEGGLPANPDPETIYNNHRQQVYAALDQRLGDRLAPFGLNIANTVRFTEEDAALLMTAGENVDARIAALAQAIGDAAERILAADLGDDQKKAFLTTALQNAGTIDEAALDTSVKAYRTAQYQAVAEAKKATFEADVEKEILEVVLKDDSCKAGVENLAKDPPKLKSFRQRMKADHKDALGNADPLATYDFKTKGVLAGLLAQKLEGAKGVFGQIDITEDIEVFKARLASAVHAAAEAILPNLKTALTASVFEDDRTILMKLALEPAKAEEFKTKLAAALKRYDDNVFGRVVQSVTANNAAVAQLKPRVHEAPEMLNPMYRELNHVEKEAPTVPETYRDDLLAGPDTKGKALGEKMRGDVRKLFADLFSPAARTADGLKSVLKANALALQALYLDPALIGTTAVPNEGKGGDAVRQLVQTFLEAIKENVNEGQLTPADFKDALTGELNGAAFAAFRAGLPTAGKAVLANLQAQLTASLTNVLRERARLTGDFSLQDKSLAELGAGGLGSFDAGYGKFLANVLDNYFTDSSLDTDHDRMLESLMRYGKTGGTVGDALSALIKGAGPIFQKVLQSIPLEGLPEEIVKALTDVKSSLAPIPPATVRARLDEAIAKNNAVANRAKIARIDIEKSLGAASVGQAILCTIHYENKARESEKVVIKLLRPGITEIATREQAFFRKMAETVDPAMVQTFQSRMDGIMQELDFTHEAQWIDRGQCYGNSQNYEDAAEIKESEEEPLKFVSMNRSGALDVQKDLLALKVANGKPLDRCNQEIRGKLDAYQKRVERRIDDGKGGKRLAYYASNGIEFVEVHCGLVRLYDRLRNERALLGELLRRFSSELFWRNYKNDPKKAPGGFMHGDLHAGNLLVDDTSMTVIDFGNSFAFNEKDRSLLVSFVAACGFSDAKLALAKVAPGLSDRNPNYANILKGVETILAKGETNDVIARGMAVVQFLQRNNVTVPGPVMNFTETVMRLSTACHETDVLLNDVGDTIVELKLDPSVKDKDPLGKAGVEGAFSEKASNRLLSKLYDMVKKNQNIPGNLKFPNALTEQQYRKYILPLTEPLRNCGYVDTKHGAPYVIGDRIRAIEAKFNLLGEEAFRTVYSKEIKMDISANPHVDELLTELEECLEAVAARFHEDLAMELSWRYVKYDGVNECLQAGLSQIGKGPLLVLIGGTASVRIGVNAKGVMKKAKRVDELRRIGEDAQRLYLAQAGILDTKTRRIVDQTVADRFLWPKGLDEELSGKWYQKADTVAKVVRALKLNLDKLHGVLAAAKIEPNTTLDNYALLALAFPNGLVDALKALKPADFETLRRTVAAEEPRLAERLAFLRGDAAVDGAIALGKCMARAMKLDNFNHDQFLKPYSFTKSSINPLPTDAEDLQDLNYLRAIIQNEFMLALEMYAETDKTGKGQPKFDNFSRAAVEYGFMRRYLEAGILQTIQKKVGLVAFAKGFERSDVADMIKQFAEYMK